MEFTLEQLGLTQETLQQRVVDQITEALMWDGENNYSDSEFVRRVHKKVEEHIDTAIAKMTSKYLAQEFADHIESIEFQDTNRYGEKKGETLTLREYIVKRIDYYLTEPVNREGKSKREDSYSFTANSTRLVWTVDKYFHDELQKRLTEAVATINQSIAGGLKTAVSEQIDAITKKLTVGVSVKK